MIKSLSELARPAINPLVNCLTKRYVARKRTIPKFWPNDWVPFVWNRPEKKPGYLGGGDLKEIGAPDTVTINSKYVKSELLHQLDQNDPCRKLFTVDHSINKAHNKSGTEANYGKLGLVHEVDYHNSLEAKIVNLTFLLRSVRALIEQDQKISRYRGFLRTQANSFKYRRFRHLYRLKALHQERYERLIKLLDIEPPDNPINQPHVPSYRKVQMRILAKDYSQQMKDKKVEEYLVSLEEEKKQFEIKKKETLEWIAEKEKELGFTVV